MKSISAFYRRRRDSGIIVHLSIISTRRNMKVVALQIPRCEAINRRHGSVQIHTTETIPPLERVERARAVGDGQRARGQDDRCSAHASCPRLNPHHVQPAAWLLINLRCCRLLGGVKGWRTERIGARQSRLDEFGFPPTTSLSLRPPTVSPASPTLRRAVRLIQTILPGLSIPLPF